MKYIQNDAEDIQSTFKYPNYQNNDRELEAINIFTYDNWIDRFNLEIAIVWYFASLHRVYKSYLIRTYKRQRCLRGLQVQERY